MGIFDKIGDFFSGALDSIGDAFSSVKDFIGDTASKVAGTIGDFAVPILGTVASFLPGPLGTIAGISTSLLSGITQSRQQPTRIVLDLSSLIEGIPKALATAVEDITKDLEAGILANISETAVEAIVTQQELSAQLFKDAFVAQTQAIVTTQQVEQALIERLIDFINDAGLNLDSIGRKIGFDLGVLTDAIGTGLDGLIRTATLGLSGVIERLIDTQSAIESETTGLIRAQTEGAESLAEAVFEQTEGIAAQAEVNRGALMDALEEHVGVPLGGVGDQVWGAARALMTGVVQDDGGKVERAIRRAASGELCGGELTGSLSQLAEEFMPQNPILRWVFGVLVSAFTWMSVFGGVTSAQAQTVLHEYGLRCPYRVLSPPDAILAHFRGQIDRETMLETIRKEGYSQSDAQSMWIASLQVPNELDLLGMWMRDIISEPEYDDAMTWRGWDERWIAAMKASGKLLPPVQDLISMAVREAFTPAAVAEFGLDQDFPEEFAFWAEKQGVSRDWAEKYWAAHWGLPSVQMGYEMLHRDVITEDQLKALMKALDIVPAWRDNLIAISFTPYTRVDIRRMHKLGILSEPEVNRAYRDLGYDPEKAANMTRFTVQLNAPSRADDAKTIADLTRAQIVGFYKEGTITRDQAARLLRVGGYIEPLIELYLDSADLDIEREERADARDLIIERAKAGVITFEEAQDELARIGLETVEQQKALNKLTRAQAAATKQPSKADLAKFRKAGIITDAEYVTRMQQLGYSALWARRFLELQTAGGTNA